MGLQNHKTMTSTTAQTKSSSSGATVHDESWPLLRLLALRPAAIVKSFSAVKAFYGMGPSTPRPTPNLEGQGILFVWIITFGLSGMGDSTSRYATAGIALRII
jgi:hypothetical protein